MSTVQRMYIPKPSSSLMQQFSSLVCKPCCGQLQISSERSTKPCIALILHTVDGALTFQLRTSRRRTTRSTMWLVASFLVTFLYLSSDARWTMFFVPKVCWYNTRRKTNSNHRALNILTIELFLLFWWVLSCLAIWAVKKTELITSPVFLNLVLSVHNRTFISVMPNQNIDKVTFITIPQTLPRKTLWEKLM